MAANENRSLGVQAHSSDTHRVQGSPHSESLREGSWNGRKVVRIVALVGIGALVATAVALCFVSGVFPIVGGLTVAAAVLTGKIALLPAVLSSVGFIIATAGAVGAALYFTRSKEVEMQPIVQDDNWQEAIKGKEITITPLGPNIRNFLAENDIQRLCNEKICKPGVEVRLQIEHKGIDERVPLPTATTPNTVNSFLLRDDHELTPEETTWICAVIPKLSTGAAEKWHESLKSHMPSSSYLCENTEQKISVKKDATGLSIEVDTRLKLTVNSSDTGQAETFVLTLKCRAIRGENSAYDTLKLKVTEIERVNDRFYSAASHIITNGSVDNHSAENAAGVGS